MKEIIRLENLVKIYDTGAVRVLGLKKISLSIRSLLNNQEKESVDEE